MSHANQPAIDPYRIDFAPVSPETEKGILGHVFGIVPVPKTVDAVAEDTIPVGPQNLVERVLVHGKSRTRKRVVRLHADRIIRY